MMPNFPSTVKQARMSYYRLNSNNVLIAYSYL